MNDLTTVLKEVRESNLSRGQLEKYEQTLTALFSEYMMRIAVLQKAESLYFYSMEQTHPEIPDIKIKSAAENILPNPIVTTGVSEASIAEIKLNASSLTPPGLLIKILIGSGEYPTSLPTI